jgi:hypothetical protein
MHLLERQASESVSGVMPLRAASLLLPSLGVIHRRLLARGHCFVSIQFIRGRHAGATIPPRPDGPISPLGLKPSFSALEMEKELKLPAERQKTLIKVLRRHRVLRVGPGNICQWNEVELREVQPMTVADDFVP